ncbi:MAG TPA: dipeptidase [Mycobacteriales bacterium]|jgi:acetylornithine deacetylase/succinyl-diaminopimelate desuccinylase-like protein|nr:dipeptidase [Mycobacteriales bacterium]
MTQDVVREWVETHQEAFLAELMEWLRIPSVSADPDRASDVKRSAEWLAEAFRRTGFPTVEIWTTDDGAPAVFAEWVAPEDSATSVVVYGHHDVQPADPEELWHSPAFEPRVDGELLLGRGAADDKGQVAFHLHGLRAWLATTGRAAPPVTLRFLVEGEEESGSPGFRALLEANRDRLRCDVVVVTDTGMWARDTPTICTGMRGMTDCQLDLHGPDVDLHSGSFGGAVPNPLHVMADLLAGLHDDDGRVTVPGFYDRVLPLSDRERELIAKLPYDEASWLADAESRATYGEAGYSTLERVWARPTCEVNGFWGGYTGPGHKTIVPGDAHAKLSFRLVADQDPLEVQDQLRAYVEANTPQGITATLHFYGQGTRPCLTPLDHPALQAVNRAMARAFDTEVLYTREGGSGPEADLADVLEAPVVFLGVGLPSDRIHAPNEQVVFPLLLTGAVAAAHLWDELAALPS